MPSIVVVALGEPGTPVTCCAAAGTLAAVTVANDNNRPSQRVLVALMVSLPLIDRSLSVVNKSFNYLYQ